MYTIRYIDSICGGGKTDSAIKRMINGVARGRKYVLLQPKISLIQQTKLRFEELGYQGPLEPIYSEKGAETVTKRIHAFLDRPDASGVLIATIQAWEAIQRRAMHEWDLIVDECPTIFRVSKIETQRLKNDLMDHLIIEDEKDGYSEVKIRPGSEHQLKNLERIAAKDKAYLTHYETTKYLNLKTKTWVKSECLESFLKGSADTLTFYHVTSKKLFEGFRSVVIMGANFTHSELYLLWRHLGVHFKKVDGFHGMPLPVAHDKAVGEKLDIYYLTVDWSKFIKQKQYDIYENEYKRAIKDIFGSKPFIHTMNDGDNPLLLQSFGNGTYVSPKAHGDNHHIKIDNAAIFAHFNISKDQASFLHNKFKLPFKIIWDIRNIDIYYQFVCRTSLREVPSAMSDVSYKKIIVMDKDMAHYIQEKFEGSRIHKFESDLIAKIEHPKKGRKLTGLRPASGAERMKKHRAIRTLEDMSRKLEILTGGYGKSNYTKKPDLCDEMILLRSDRVDTESRGWSVSILGKLDGDNYEQSPMGGFDDIVSYLKDQSQRYIESKHKNALFNITKFTPQSGDKQRRRIEDVMYSNAILMDMDSEQNHDPEEFAKFFSGIEMVIYSSFQSSQTRRRWRVVVNLSRAVTEAEYNRIAKDLLTINAVYGYDFDRKMRANDFMYLPCRGENGDAFFFQHYRDDSRKPLDVDSWLGIEGKKMQLMDDFDMGANTNVGIASVSIPTNIK